MKSGHVMSPILDRIARTGHGAGRRTDVIMESTKEWNHEPDHGELVAVDEPTLEECLSRNKASIIKDNSIYIQATLHSS